MLETKRLVLRKLNENDADSIFNNWAKDKEVTTYLTWAPHENIEITKELLNMWLEAYKDEKTHRFGIVLKDEDKLIGMIDVVNYIDNCPEIGYVLSRTYWNQGIMTEACNKMIDYLFEQGFPTVYIKAYKDNIGSNKVIQKCGLTYYAEETLPQDQNILVSCYKINKEERHE